MRYGTRPQGVSAGCGTARQPPVKPRRPCRTAAGTSAASLPEAGDARPPRANGAAERVGKRQPRRCTRTAPRGAELGPPGTPRPRRPPGPVTTWVSSAGRRVRDDRPPYVRTHLPPLLASPSPAPVPSPCPRAQSSWVIPASFAVPGRSQGGAAPGRSPVARLGVVQVTSGDRAASYSAAHTRSWFMTRPYADAPPPAPAHEGRRSHDSGLLSGPRRAAPPPAALPRGRAGSGTAC